MVNKKCCVAPKPHKYDNNVTRHVVPTFIPIGVNVAFIHFKHIIAYSYGLYWKNVFNFFEKYVNRLVIALIVLKSHDGLVFGF